MKIVCVVGSPHGLAGNTFRLAESVIEGIRNEGGEVRIALLGDGAILPCQGCDTCHSAGECPQEDDFPELCQAIAESDGIILVSPNYLGSVTAQMKAFMDRCCGAIHRLSFTGRYGISVVTSGGDDDRSIIDYMSRFLLMTGIRPVGGVYAAMAMQDAGQFTAEVRQRAEDLGGALVRAWREGHIDPQVEQEMAAFRERMRQLVVGKKEEWPYEYSYWQEHHGMA